jgi:hypothetical protein
MSAGTSRRALLGRIGAAAGVAAVAGVAGTTAKGRSAVPSVRVEPLNPVIPGAISGADWRLIRPGVAPGTLPPIGTPSLPVGHLVDAEGEHIGMFESSVMPGSGNGTHLHHLTFDDGTLSAVGPSTTADASFAVIGGTGRFAGVSGSYHLSQSPAPSGGTAEFTFAITVPGGQQ